MGDGVHCVLRHISLGLAIVPLCHADETKAPPSKKCISNCVGYSTNHLYFNIL